MSEEFRVTIEQRLSEFLVDSPILNQGKLKPDVKESLIKCLLDGSVYSVINSLTHLQELKETKVRELGEEPDEEQIKEIDRGIIEQIDELVNEQQSNLCCVGIPLFKVTKDRDEIKIQIELIKFIQSLSDVFTH